MTDSLIDSTCPKHGRFLGTNCTYCDYPPLFNDKTTEPPIPSSLIDRLTEIRDDLGATGHGWHETIDEAIQMLQRCEISVIDEERLACIAADVAFEVTECGRKGRPVIGRIAAMLRPYLRTTEPVSGSLDYYAEVVWDRYCEINNANKAETWTEFKAIYDIQANSFKEYAKAVLDSLKAQGVEIDYD